MCGGKHLSRESPLQASSVGSVGDYEQSPPILLGLGSRNDQSITPGDQVGNRDM